MSLLMDEADEDDDEEDDDTTKGECDTRLRSLGCCWRGIPLSNHT